MCGRPPTSWSPARKARPTSTGTLQAASGEWCSRAQAIVRGSLPIARSLRAGAKKPVQAAQTRNPLITSIEVFWEGFAQRTSHPLHPQEPLRHRPGSRKVISVRRGRKCFICRSDPDEHIVWRLTEMQLGTVRQAERRAPIRPRLPLATGRRLVEALRNCCALRKCSRKGRQRLLRELLQLRMIAALDRSYKATISL